MTDASRDVLPQNPLAIQGSDCPKLHIFPGTDGGKKARHAAAY